MALLQNDASTWKDMLSLVQTKAKYLNSLVQFDPTTATGQELIN